MCSKYGLFTLLQWTDTSPAHPFLLPRSYSLTQGDTTGQLQRRSIPSLLSQVVRADGVGGLYRGISLGAIRSLVVNGISMVAYEFVLNLHRKRQGGAGKGIALKFEKCL